MSWLWWGCPDHGGDVLTVVGMSWLWWGCSGHGGNVLAMVGMPWPCTPQACTASPLSVPGMGHRSRGSVSEQRLGGGCCVTWGILISQLGLLQGSGISLSHAA